MDTDNIFSPLNDRFEDSIGFRFHENVHAALILEQMVKEHGRGNILQAFDRFLEKFDRSFEPDTALQEFITNFKCYSG
jgi:hypothetical protein